MIVNPIIISHQYKIYRILVLLFVFGWLLILILLIKDIIAGQNSSEVYKIYLNTYKLLFL